MTSRHVSRSISALIVALAVATLAQPATAGGAGAYLAKAHVVGSVDGSARTYFTVRLRTGATHDDADVVAGYFRGRGLSVETDADDGILFVSGSYDQAAAAAGGRYSRVASRGAQFVMMLSQPVFPAEVASRIMATTVAGGPPALGPSGANPNGITTGPGNGYQPANIYKYYDYGSIETNGKQAVGSAVAVIVCGAISTADIQSYEQAFGLPIDSPSSVSVDGGSTTTEFGTTAQVELLIATAQEAGIIVYVLPANCGVNNLVDATAKALADTKTLKFTSLMIGYGAFEDVYDFYGLDSYLTAEDANFKALAGKGVTTFASTGDNSGFSNLESGDPGVFFPGSDPNVVSVGATMALQNSGGTRMFEPASFYTGGGPSAKFAIPTWQKGVPGMASKTQRNVPDVSINGDCQLEYYAVYSSSPYYVCGSAYGTDMWGGLLALIDSGRHAAGKKPLTAVAAKLYAERKIAGLFVDVTKGCNGVYCAATGYDDVSGLGVPDATILYNTLVGLP